MDSLLPPEGNSDSESAAPSYFTLMLLLMLMLAPNSRQLASLPTLIGRIIHTKCSYAMIYFYA